MRHILITRFNIRFGPAVRAGVDALQREWLEHRHRLFTAYCIPSVEAQEDRDFEWFVLFHPETPRRYYDCLDGVATVVLAPDLRSAKKKISARYLFRGPTLTTRLDNDDCIAIDFTARIRAAAEAAVEGKFGNRTDFVVVPRSGGLSDISSGKWLAIQTGSPAYVALFEAPRVWRKWQTPLDFNHLTIVDQYPVIYADEGRPMWLSVVHDRNLSNRRFKRQPDRDLDELTDRFPALRPFILDKGARPAPKSPS